MTSDLIGLLLETCLASSAAILLVLVLRRTVRRSLGANIAYVLWLLVPVAVVAVLVPRAAGPTAMEAGIPLIGAGLDLVSLREVGSVDGAWRGAALGAWFAGSVAMLVRLCCQQRRFLEGLGTLGVVDGGLLQADASTGLPAVIGVLRPRIVLPVDFEARYEPAERELILQHESIHVQRFDLQINALAAAMRCVYWFNPLVHVAVQRFRHDQELACDELVVVRNPDRRRTYGEAMLKTQLQHLPLPVGCHWQACHPFKERIEMLKRPVPRMLHWVTGGALVALLAMLTAFAAFSAQPATGASAANAVTDLAERDAASGEGVAAPGTGAPDVTATREVLEIPHRPPPSYPAEAAAQNVSGRVMLLMDVAPDGSVSNIEVERSEPAGVFDAAAVSAARKWRFNPEMKDGQVVGGRVRVPVDFRADGDGGD